MSVGTGPVGMVVPHDLLRARRDDEAVAADIRQRLENLPGGWHVRVRNGRATLWSAAGGQDSVGCHAARVTAESVLGVERARVVEREAVQALDRDPDRGRFG